MLKHISLLLFLLCGNLYAQETTIDLKDEKKPKAEDTLRKPKILIVPFEEKMYMSDVDKSINRETKKSFIQIRDEFRFGLMNYLKSQYRGDFEVVTLLDDTTKMKKDLVYTYNSIGLKYISVTTGQAAKSSGVKNGQLMAPGTADERYMNTVIKSQKLLLYYKKKYDPDYILFVNQLDLKTDLNSLGSTGKRNTAIHYTLFDISGKQLKGGLAKSQISNTVNDPKKIMSGSFPSMTKTVEDGTPKSLYTQVQPSGR